MIAMEPILAHVLPFQMVLSRMVGVFVFMPFLSGASMPMRVRALLAFTLSLAVYPLLAPAAMSGPLDLWTVLPVLFGEVLVGVVLGALAALPIMAMQMGGQIMGYQMGLSLAQAYNPELDMEQDVVGQLLFTITTTLWLVLGGLEALFLGIVRSFERLPAGGLPAREAPLQLYVDLLASGTELALRVSAPVVGLLILVMLTLGFVMKTMPQINILSVGFAIKVFAGLLILVWAIVAIADAAEAETVGALREMLRFAAGGGAGG